ncbi:MAG: DUF4302 domain-containing protein [Paludibacteraceae bacterium]|nr:DUF4302 domain-containing protein [Paludibacteraceae bacterium]
MKAFNKIYVFAALIALVFCGVACSDQEAVFDKPAVERLNSTGQELKDLLLSASNGWEVLYFANPESSGYVLFADFKADGSVKVAAKNDAATIGEYKEDVSVWDVNIEDGAILVFSTYNSVLHAYSDPRSDGNGLLGDYEMKYMYNNGDTLLFKGKKYGAYIRFIRFPDGQSWNGYLDEVEKRNESLFDGVDSLKMTMVRNGVSTDVTYANGAFTWNEYDNPAVTEGEYTLMSRAFLVRPNGIMFERSIKVGDKAATNFSLDATGTYLECTDGADVQIRHSSTFANLFYDKMHERVQRNYQKMWKVDTSAFSASAAALYKDITDSIEASSTTTPCKIMNVYYMRDGDGKSRVDTCALAIQFRVGESTRVGHLYFGIRASGRTLVLTPTYADQDGAAVLRRAADGDFQRGSAKFVNLFLGMFTISSASESNFNIGHLLLTRSSDASISLKVDSYINGLE